MTDENLESMIGNVLRVGALSSAAIVAISGMFYLIEHYADHVNYAAFRMERTNLRVLSGIVQSAMRLRSDAIIQMGLVLLIATPIARVALAAVGFYLEHDHLYVGISLTVLAILVYSIIYVV